MPANPTPAEGVVAPLDPDFAEALIEKLTEIATRDDLKGRHVVFNTEVRSIATIVGVAAKVIGRPLAARPAAPPQSAAQTGEVERLRAALERIQDWIRYDVPIGTRSATVMLTVVNNALSQPKPSQ